VYILEFWLDSEICTKLRCLNTVCARSMICTADVNKRAHKALRKTNMAPVGVCTAIISFCAVKIVQVFFPS